MTLIFLEKKSAENQIDVEGNKDPHITNKFLQTAIQTLIRSESNQRLLDAFVNELVLKFHDITFFTLVGLKSIIQSDIPSLESTVCYFKISNWKEKRNKLKRKGKSKKNETKNKFGKPKANKRNETDSF